MKKKFDFLRKSKVTIGISFILIVISLVSIISKGGFKLGIDFAGGTSFNLYFPKKYKLDSEKIKKVMKQLKISGEVTTSRSIGEEQKRKSLYISLREFNIKIQNRNLSSSDVFLHEVFKKFDKINVDYFFDKTNSIKFNVKNNAISMDELVKILSLTPDELRLQRIRENEVQSQHISRIQMAPVVVPANANVRIKKDFESRLGKGRIYGLMNGTGFLIQIDVPKNINKMDLQEKHSRFRKLIFQKLMLSKKTIIHIEGRQKIGAKIGKYFVSVSIKVILLVSLLILIYIAVRFQFKFGLAAVIALLHDVVIALGFVSILNIEMDITIIAAVLTLIGYSINDTIVVFDRIRENTEKISANKDEYINVVNLSIHHSLSRTLITSLTTLLVVFVLLVRGADAIYSFSLLLFIGIFIGTYSSIFIASPVLVIWDRFIEKYRKNKKIKQKKKVKQKLTKA